MKNIFSCLLIGLIAVAHLGSAPLALARPVVIEAALLNVLDQSALDQPLAVIVTLRDQADVAQLDRSAVPLDLQRHAARTQADLLTMLHAQPTEQVRSITSLWIDNAIALSASRQIIFDLAQRSDVARIQLDETFLMPDRAAAQTAIAPNLISIGAPAVWQRGITGQGVVVAVLDSGVDVTNADLNARWRGGSNSWFDPYGEHASPADLSGHGTQVLGAILGGNDAGVPIGVAPGAQWIAAKIFNDRGRATQSAIHRALQWVLDPDGDPATPDAPQVVNNSWSSANPGCNSDFTADLQALRAAGILPIFAAGTNVPIGPADTPDAFAVGALDNDTTLLSDSAHGPSNCLNANEVYPQIVAPGAHIHTTDRYGMYADVSGTSIAAAQVSGALALLLSVKPGLSAADQAALLTGTAVDLGKPGPDNAFGYGRLDVAALIDRVLGPAQSFNPMFIIGGSVLVIVVLAWRLRNGYRRRASASSSIKVQRHVRWQDPD